VGDELGGGAQPAEVGEGEGVGVRGTTALLEERGEESVARRHRGRRGRGPRKGGGVVCHGGGRSRGGGALGQSGDDGPEPAQASISFV